MTTYNAPPDQVNNLTLNKGDTLYVAKGVTVSGITVTQGAVANIDGTSFGSVLQGGVESIGVEGSVNNLVFFSEDGRSAGDLQLANPASVHGTLEFGPGTYNATILFSIDVDVISLEKSTNNTLIVKYGNGETATWHYDFIESDQIVEFVLAAGVGGFIQAVVASGGERLSFFPESAGTIVYTAEFGSAPSASGLTVLSHFAQTQFDYGQKLGVMDPSIYAFQALGVALASGPHFQDTFGPSNSLYPVSTVGDVHFVDDSYVSVFGRAGTAAQIQHFVDQLNYFEALYTAAGIFGSASNVDLLARGAIYGQMLGIEHESALIGNPEGGTTYTAPPTQNNLVLNNEDVLNINSTGLAFDTKVNAGGIVNVNDGGKSFSSTLGEGGIENVNSGGQGVTTTINSGGIQYLNSGGEA
jgi:autotransporter passenger strand-loop-strand repeat protein